MSTKADVWDCPPGEERVLKFKAPITKRTWVLYLYCLLDGFPFATVARDAETARIRRDIFFQQRCMTVPKPELRLRQERVPASECCDARCSLNSPTYLKAIAMNAATLGIGARA